ncbi:MAG: DUF2125 domain-containing protein, partial [Caulobacteraceae bacterium]
MTSPATPPRAGRLGLYGPLIALAIAVATWSLGWLWLKGAAERGLDAAASRLAHAGGAFTWQGRRVHGYPFRLDVDFTNLTWREPTGWAVTVPRLKSEAFVFAPEHWVAMAPDGVVLIRPAGGAVKIAAKLLRASLSAPAADPPTVSLEGLGLTFTPLPGAAPYFLQGARELHVHTRAGPSDQGAFYFELDGARPAPTSAIGRMTLGAPVTLIANAIYSHASAARGPGWASAVRAWARAGGQVESGRLRLAAGPFAFDARGAGLSA